MLCKAVKNKWTRAPCNNLYKSQKYSLRSKQVEEESVQFDNIYKKS